MERRNITDSPMEIYIHIPFCIKKCDYCDFLSGPSGPKEQADYVDALLEEINAAEEGKGYNRAFGFYPYWHFYGAARRR